MPDLTYLHIQGRESDPTRVLALPGTAVRVGRGPHCEVCLPAEDGLAEVQCMLRRRGGDWQIQPVGPAGHIWLDGEPIDHLRPWPAGSVLQVGSHRLVIRPSEFGTYQSPYDLKSGFGSARPVETHHPASVSTPPIKPSPMTADNSQLDVERLRRWQARLEQRERFLQTRQDEKKWEVRWKAAGEGIRARSAASSTTIDRPSTLPSRPHTMPSPAQVAPPRQSTSVRVTETPISRILQTTRPIVQPSLPPPEVKVNLPVVMPAPVIPPTPEVVEVLPVVVEAIVETPEIQIAPEVEAVVESIETLAEAPQVETISSVVEFAEPAPEVESEPESEPETEPEPQIVTVLPIESAIQREAERSDPIWTEPAAFVANVTATSTEVWHEATVAPAAVAPSRPTEIPDSPKTEILRDAYPSASSIFAAQGKRVVIVATDASSPSRSRKKKARKHVPQPTVAYAPEAWVMPSWLATPPVALVCLGVIGVGLLLGFFWTKEANDAGIAAKAAFRVEDGRPAPLDPNVRPEMAWWKTTPLHLTQWGMAIVRSPEAVERAGELNELLSTASRSAPLQREVKFAFASDISTTAADPAARMGRTLGLSRDVVSLTLTARSLKISGKKDASIRAYRSAMELASDADLPRLDAPAFDDDRRVQRFHLPHEGLIQSAARDMAEAGEWSLDDWKKASPERPVARLAIARILREKGNADADAMFDFALANDIALPRNRGLYAENLAAKAEALAFKEKKTEAVEEYRKAIDLAPTDATKRRWRLAMAELLSQAGATGERAELLELAKGGDPNEDVTKRALAAQKDAGLK